MRLIYVFTDVPHQTGTFAVAEVEAMAAHGLEVEMVCLRSRLTDAEGARELRSRFLVRASSYLSVGVLVSTLIAFVKRPIWFLRSLLQLVSDTIGSPRILIKTLAVLPKCCHFARQIQGRYPTSETISASRPDRSKGSAGPGPSVPEGYGEVLFVAFWASLPARAAWWMSGLTGIPYGTWAHAGADIYNKKHQTVRSLGTVLGGARFVLTCNKANLGYFERTLDPSALAKVIYHPHGVDLGRFGFQEEIRIPPPGEPIRMLSVGRLSAAKGFQFAVEACAELARRGLDFRYRIIGEGPLREDLQRSIRAYGLEGKVELLGYREQSALPAEYSSADLYLAPSVVGPGGARDGLPNVVLEAMASGVAVVGSNTVGIPEVIQDGETGILVAPGDALSIADGVQRLAADQELRRRVRSRAADLVRRRYDRRLCMQRVAVIYRSRGANVPSLA